MTPDNLYDGSREEIGGWISPTGEFFRVEYCGHYSMAEDIVDYYLRVDEEYKATYLETSGWIRLETDGEINHDFQATIPQINLLYDIYNYAVGREYRKNLSRYLTPREQAQHTKTWAIPGQGDQENMSLRPRWVY